MTSLFIEFKYKTIMKNANRFIIKMGNIYGHHDTYHIGYGFEPTYIKYMAKVYTNEREANKQAKQIGEGCNVIKLIK